MPFKYFDSLHAIRVHDDIILASGGLFGILNEGLLNSSIKLIENDDYYPTIETKLTHLFYSINKNHCFQDGNKRASIALSAYFLEINDFKELIVEQFIEKMEHIAVDVADNRIGKDLLLKIITSLLFEYDYSESLKLEIAIAKGLNNFSDHFTY